MFPITLHHGQKAAVFQLSPRSPCGGLDSTWPVRRLQAAQRPFELGNMIDRNGEMFRQYGSARMSHFRGKVLRFFGQDQETFAPMGFAALHPGLRGQGPGELVTLCEIATRRMSGSAQVRK